jgi:hypothetical protein
VTAAAAEARIAATQAPKQLAVPSISTGGTPPARPVVLPAAYVARDVELPHGTTNNRSQGGTVDTAHSLITPQTSRENLYVAATPHGTTPSSTWSPTSYPAWTPTTSSTASFPTGGYAAREILTAILSRVIGCRPTVRDRDELVEEDKGARASLWDPLARGGIR